MAHVITAVFAITLIIGGALTLTNASLSSAINTSSSWSQMADRGGSSARTKLTLISADPNSTTTNVDISMRNAGQTTLAEFPKWDTFIRYYSTSTNLGMKLLQLAYTTSTQPAHGQWTVRGIYLNASSTEPEVYDPDLFNPGEEIVLRLNISPAIPAQTDNLVVVGAANGVTIAVPFSR